MNATELASSSMCLCGLFLLGGCAAPGPGYDDVMAQAEPLADQSIRFVFLRPKDADDGANGGAASIDVNHERIGALRYGGFFYTDVTSETTVLAAYGRYRAFGACEIGVTTTPGSTVFIDVGPRLSYMVAGALGGAVGGIAGAAAVPDVFGGAGAAIATGTAGMAAGDVAGTAAAITVESRGKRCRGPLTLEAVAEEDALPRLKELTWSKD